MFAVAFILAANSRNKFLKPSNLAATGLSVAAVIIIAVSYFPHVLPPMFIPGEGLTPLKIYLEWVAIAFYVGAIYMFEPRGGRSYNTILMQTALIVGIFSELAFTLYDSAYDSYNMLGHILKVIAYALIFKALFVSSFQKPYSELIDARNKIQDSFSKMGDALASSLDPKKMLYMISDLSSEILGSKYASVMLLKDGVLRIEASKGLSADADIIPAENTLAWSAIHEKEPAFVSNVTQITNYDPKCHCQQLEGACAQSVVSAPIMLDKTVLGVIEVYSPNSGAFGTEEAQLLYGFSRQASVALRNSMTYEKERKIADVLQSNLLPSEPVIEKHDIAVDYIPADDASKVGGDLYDIYKLDDDHLAILVGDVCGHGLEAASMMATAVYSIKSQIMQGLPPGEALNKANASMSQYAKNQDDLIFVTAFLAVLNLKTHQMKYCNAGHHMPVVLRESGSYVMPLNSHLPLVIDEDLDYQTSESNVDANGLLFFTQTA